MMGFDLLMAGAALGVGGALLLGKSNLAPSYPEKLAASFLGANPFQLRNLICQRFEAISGALWLGLSFVALAAGTVITSLTVESGTWTRFGVHILGVVALFAVLWLVTLWITKIVSRRKYLPEMIKMQRDGFEQTKSFLENNGLDTNEIERKVNIDQTTREHRMLEATSRLDQFGELIDLIRRTNESDRDYLQRIQIFFGNTPKQKIPLLKPWLWGRRSL
jgi:hypothetical protein